MLVVPTSAPTVEGSRASASRVTTKASSTVTRVPAEYFEGIEDKPDQDHLSYTNRYLASIDMVIEEDGKTLDPDSKVHIQDPAGTVFSLRDQGYGEYAKENKDVQQGSLLCTNQSGTSFSYLAWPPTGEIPGGGRQEPDGQDEKGSATDGEERARWAQD
jgi:hypothetical protein